MAAEEQGLTVDQSELVGIGVSIGAGCQPCVSYHLQAGNKAGLSAERLLAGVVNAELAAAEAAERLGEHVRVQLGSDVSEPKATSPFDRALATLGGALGANDLVNVEHQLLVCRQLGMSQPQLRAAIELGRTIQDNSTRMHFRGALNLLERITANDGPVDGPARDASPGEEAAPKETSADRSDFVSMMAKLLALMDSSDSAALNDKMAQCFAIFAPGGQQPDQAAAGNGPAASSPWTNSTSCNCTGC